MLFYFVSIIYLSDVIPSVEPNILAVALERTRELRLLGSPHEDKEDVVLVRVISKEKHPGAGDGGMAQRLRAPAVLPEVLSSISGNRMVAHSHL